MSVLKMFHAEVGRSIQNFYTDINITTQHYFKWNTQYIVSDSVYVESDLDDPLGKYVIHDFFGSTLFIKRLL